MKTEVCGSDEEVAKYMPWGRGSGKELQLIRYSVLHFHQF